jgi:uncharacterized membrane protein YhiD involved in acid resistance
MHFFDSSNLGSVLTLISALTAAIVTILNAIFNFIKSNKVEAKAEVVAAKLDIRDTKSDTAHNETSQKLDSIKLSTDGNLDKIQDKLDALQVRVEASDKRANELQSIIGSLTAGLNVSINKLPDTNGHK